MKQYIALVLLVLFGCAAFAQNPVAISGEMQTLKDGKRYLVHVIQPGQTVYSITRAYDVKEYEAVTKKDIHKLSVGDTVWIPYKGQKPTSNTAAPQQSGYKFITVKQGQTLYGISRTYGVSVEDLMQLNPELSDGLKAGQQLRVPSTAKTEAQDKNSSATAPKPNGGLTKQDPKAAPSGPRQFYSTSAEVRPRIDPSRIYITVMMPLYLDQVNNISTTKFDTEQRGKKEYKSFEFIQFYEGLMLGLETLEQQGIQVVLNVVDVPGSSAAEVEAAYRGHQVGQSDAIIALLTKEPFETVAALAQADRVFVVNPIATRSELVATNPYVVKCMPSVAAQVEATLKVIKHNMPDAHLVVIHSNNKQEKEQYNEVVRQLEERGDIQYTLFDWSVSGKLSTVLKQHPGCAILSVYNQNKDKNRIFVSTLLNRLSAVKNNPPTLFSFNDFTRDYADVDFAQLQHVNYHTVYTTIDYGNASHKEFQARFRERFKTEPLGMYATMANDIILYVVTGLEKQKDNFWKSPSIATPQGMLYPVRFKITTEGGGYENQAAWIYKMSDYHFVPATPRK